MFKRNRVFGVIICLLIVNVFAVNGFCVINLNSGDVMGAYMGVVAKSNGEYWGKPYGEGAYAVWINYQCVAYVKRFYRQYYNLGLDQISVGQARNYYLKFEPLNFAQFGLERYENNGYVPPKPTDILVFNGTTDGHVSIIKNVTPTTIEVIEQNVDRNNCYRTLPFTITNGQYYIKGPTSYPVLGWLGLPRDSNVTCRWDFNSTGWCEDWTRTNIEGYSVENGSFCINPGKPDPYINSPAISISATNSALIISMASNAPDGVAAVYFTTSTDSSWDEDKKVDFSVINDGQYHKYCIPMVIKSKWKDIITNIRIDPADKGVTYTNRDMIKIDYISLIPPDWDFNINFNLEGWTMTKMEDYSVENGIFSINPSGSDPYINSPPIAKSANELKFISICMASNAPDGVGALYFTTADSPNWNEAKKVPFTIINDGKYHNYSVYMGNNAYWQGTITNIRIDPTNYGIPDTGDDTIGINCIHLF